MALRESSKRRFAAFRARGAKDAAAATLAAPAPTSKSERRRYLRLYVNWLWPFRFSLLFILGITVIVAALDLTWPLAIKLLMDMLQNPSVPPVQKLQKLNIIGVSVIAVIIAKQATDSFRGRVQTLNAKVVYRLRRSLFHRLIELPLSALGEMKSGGIVTRLSGDVDAVSGFVQGTIISPGVSAIRIVFTLGILVFLSWRLATASLIALPPLALASFLWLRRVRPIYRSVREDVGNIDGRVNETFGGLRVVRAFRREPRERRTYALGQHTVIRKQLYATRVELTLEAIWGVLIPVTSITIFWYGGYLMLRTPPQATIGDITAFQVYTALLLPPLWQIVQSVSATQRSLAAMERIFAVLQLAPDKPDAPGAVDAPDIVEEMRFENVCFSYPIDTREHGAGASMTAPQALAASRGSGDVGAKPQAAGAHSGANGSAIAPAPAKEVLSDVNLSVSGGSTVALVGPSGAGKTTITDLVARFHDPTRGRITLNGIDIREMGLQSYRSLLAIVQQETFLFDGTVRENISYGRRNVTDADITDAATRANAHEFIAKLPQGYDTLVGERGFKLSGGQRQRLSIARAILANPRLLILDEATSNLDTESEQLIQASLAELFAGRTTFVIAHRLSTIAHADLIVVILSGRIVETGTHEELLARRGSYYDMVERQRSAFDTVGGA